MENLLGSLDQDRLLAVGTVGWCRRRLNSTSCRTDDGPVDMAFTGPHSARRSLTVNEITVSFTVGGGLSAEQQAIGCSCLALRQAVKEDPHGLGAQGVPEITIFKAHSALRVCPGTSSGIAKFSEHEAD